MDMDTAVQRDFFYYQRWSFRAPIGILVAVLIVGLICILLTAIGRRCFGSKESYLKLPWGMRFFFDGLRDLTLRTTRFLLFEFEHNKAVKSHVYLLYGVQVRLFVLQYLFIVLLTIYSVCLLIFWNTFLVEATVDECNTLFDCFPVHRVNETHLETNPITDCDDYPVTDNVSVLCFQLVYRYSEGLGEAGGFLFSMQVMANLLIYIVIRIVRTMLKLYKIIVYRRKRKPMDEEELPKHFRCLSWFTKILAVLLVLTAYFVVIVLIPLWLFSDRRDFQETLRTPQRQLQLFLYEYTIFVLFLVPLIVGVGINSSGMYKELEVEAYVQPPKSNTKNENGTTSTAMTDSVSAHPTEPPSTEV